MTDRALARFNWLYPAANAGAYIAFLPLLTIAVPLRAEGLAGAGKVVLLSETLLAGVIVATIANVVAGLLSDRSRARAGTRLPWLWIGLAGAWASYALIAMAPDGWRLMLGVVLFQLFFNTMFSPMTALFADKVPDRLKGRVSAYTNLAWPLGSLASALVGLPVLATDGARILTIAVMMGGLILPLMLFWPRDLPDTADTGAGAGIAVEAVARRWAAFRSLWFAKFMVQLSGTVLTGYFLFYLKDGVRLAGPEAQLGFAWTMTVATAVTALASLGAGRWSDRSGRRRPFLLGAIALMAAGLLLMLARPDRLAAMGGYTLFSAGLGVFLTIDVALVAQILPSARHRGRDLGLMNCANTLPAVAGPLVAMATLDDAGNGYGALFLVLLAGLAAGGVAIALGRALR
ncbi:MFS transporter [Sphingomonas quercus]|uniref:MFS transporter n=1 Tax=Sphingomonas quercus TaxID=2842451 RepID=A0ABS6BJW8_9SPHN|nr:MFS transporter [Sphingomonas quercus]MBU3077736.1 MFS transporter [Sphingomonas quercus]